MVASRSTRPIDCIVAVASDRPFPQAKIPVVPLDDVAAICDIVLAKALPIDEVVARLTADRVSS